MQPGRNAELDAARERERREVARTRNIVIAVLAPIGLMVVVAVSGSIIDRSQAQSRSVELANVAASVSAEQKRWNAAHPPTDAAAGETATPIETVAPIATATTETDPMRRRSNLCPYAAERTIKKMTRCGLNTDGFTVDVMCKTFGYDKLLFLESRSCTELDTMIATP